MSLPQSRESVRRGEIDLSICFDVPACGYQDFFSLFRHGTLGTLHLIFSTFDGNADNLYNDLTPNVGGATSAKGIGAWPVLRALSVETQTLSVTVLCPWARHYVHPAYWWWSEGQWHQCSAALLQCAPGQLQLKCSLPSPVGIIDCIYMGKTLVTNTIGL